MARMRRCLLFLAIFLVQAAAARAEDSAAIDAVALFARNCATCHGLDGSGTGPSVLDRPARNFKEGGFSFGNTPEAIARTLAHGIPGSPMPSFEGVLSADERRALAEYVVTLGPPIKEVTEAETLMVVKDRPLVVRGILPPLLPGGAVIPRGLLIGTPDGLTFEYDVQDVRLLAVRAGEFARRTDWGGRGGTPLEPLGKVVWSDPLVEPDGPWFATKWESIGHMKRQPAITGPLRAHLVSTTVEDAQGSLHYALVAADGASPVAIVEERGQASLAHGLAGFARRLAIRAPPTGVSAVTLMLRIARVASDDWSVHPGASSKDDQDLDARPRLWARTTVDGSAEILSLSAVRPREQAYVSARTSADALEVVVPVEPGGTTILEVGLFVAPTLSRTLEDQLYRENE